jgi:hypothetical protein
MWAIDGPIIGTVQPMPPMPRGAAGKMRRLVVFYLKQRFATPKKGQRSRVDVDLVKKRFSCNPPIFGLAVFDLSITYYRY